MSIVSEVNIEAEDLAYAQGFWDGFFWPITLVKFALGVIRARLSERKARKQYEDFKKFDVCSLYDFEEVLPPQGDAKWYSESKLPFIPTIVKNNDIK